MGNPEITIRRVAAWAFLALLAWVRPDSTEAAQAAQPAPARAETSPVGDNMGPSIAALKLKVSRWGRVLNLQLADGAGGRGSPRSLADPPRFAVYRDGQQIGSGTFRYG